MPGETRAVLSQIEHTRALQLPSLCGALRQYKFPLSEHVRLVQAAAPPSKRRLYHDLRCHQNGSERPLEASSYDESESCSLRADSKLIVQQADGRSVERELGVGDTPLTLGVVLDGPTPAAGIGNIVLGLAHFLAKLPHPSALYGYQQGPLSILSQSALLLWSSGGHGLLYQQLIANLSGSGGLGCGSSFKMLAAAGTLKKAARKLRRSTLDGLVVAAAPAEFVRVKEFARHANPVPVLVVPCSVEGTDKILTVGFDTCRQTMAEFVGNIVIDSISSRKYYHYVRAGKPLLTLETALAVTPTLAIFPSRSLEAAVNEAVDTILLRAKTRNNRSGVILVSSDLFTASDEIRDLCGSLKRQSCAFDEASSFLKEPQQVRLFEMLPRNVQASLTGSADLRCETVEEVFALMIEKELHRRGAFRGARDLGLLYKCHNVTDERTCATPSDLDCCYAYNAGIAAGVFILAGATAKLVTFDELHASIEDWVPRALPLDGEGLGREGCVNDDCAALEVFRKFAPTWKLHESYRCPGPIQFSLGPLRPNSLPFVVQRCSSSELERDLGLRLDGPSDICPRQVERLQYQPRLPSVLSQPFEIQDACVTPRLSRRPDLIELLFPHTHGLRACSFERAAKVTSVTSAGAAGPAITVDQQYLLTSGEQSISACDGPPADPLQLSPPDAEANSIGLCGYVGGRSVVKLPPGSAPFLRCFSADLQNNHHQSLEWAQQNTLEYQVRSIRRRHTTFQPGPAPPPNLRHHRSYQSDTSLVTGSGSGSGSCGSLLVGGQGRLFDKTTTGTSSKPWTPPPPLHSRHRQWSWCDAAHAPNFRCGEILSPAATHDQPLEEPSAPPTRTVTASQSEGLVSRITTLNDDEGPAQRAAPATGPLAHRKGPRVAVCFLGRPAPGALNVLWGAAEYLQKIGGQIFGCDGGLDGLLRGLLVPLELRDVQQRWANQGGLGFLCRTGEQCEAPADLWAAWRTCERHQLDSLLLCGGPSAVVTTALLADLCAARHCNTTVNAVPMSIENSIPLVETTLGHATTLSVFESLVGTFMTSSRCERVWSFLRISGRAQSSQLCVECALATHPSLVLVSEEIAEQGLSLLHLSSLVADTVELRHRQGLDFGVVLLSDNLLEYVPEIGVLLAEINSLTQNERDFASSSTLQPAAAASGADETKITFSPHIARGAGAAEKIRRREEEAAGGAGGSLERLQNQLTSWSLALYNSLPRRIQIQLAFQKDRRLQVDLSSVETEMLLAEMTQQELSRRKAAGGFRDGVFRVKTHSLTYQGRAALPIDYDCDLGYSLGYASAALAQARRSGYLIAARGAQGETGDWRLEAVPALCLIEAEHPPPTTETPTDQSATLRLCLQLPPKMLAAPRRQLAKNRSAWLLEDHFCSTGPVQFDRVRKALVDGDSHRVEQCPLETLHQVHDMSLEIQRLCERHALSWIPHIARTVLEGALQVLNKIVVAETNPGEERAHAKYTSSTVAATTDLPFLRAWLQK